MLWRNKEGERARLESAVGSRKTLEPPGTIWKELASDV